VDRYIEEYELYSRDYHNRYDWYLRKLSADNLEEDEKQFIIHDFIQHPKKAKYKEFPHKFTEIIRPMIKIAKMAVKKHPQYIDLFRRRFREVVDFVPQLQLQF